MKPVKRVYREATVEPAGAESRLLLDGRPARTPKAAELAVPCEALARAIAAEWNAQGEKIDPETMPLTSLATTALDLVRPRRDEVVAEIAAYAETDMICHRAEHPAPLVERQSALWQPLLDWAALELDALLRPTVGILPVEQNPAALGALERALAAHDDFGLTAISLATRVSGSLVVSLALARGRIDAKDAFEAAELDASFQIETWGEDDEAHRRRGEVRSDLESAEALFRLLTDDESL